MFVTNASGKCAIQGKNPTLTKSPCYSMGLAVRVVLNPLNHVDCLSKNSYQEEKCTAQVDALYECCNAFYQKHGDAGKTLSCPKASLLRFKMKQRQQDVR